MVGPDGPKKDMHLEAISGNWPVPVTRGPPASRPGGERNGSGRREVGGR